MKKKYEVFDHTGDIGMKVWGESREELLKNASLALTDTIADLSTIEAKREVEWAVTADTPEGLLVKQLQELLFQLDAHEMVFSQFQIKLTGLNSISCLALGERLSRELHQFKTEIKAVTYHQLKIWNHKAGDWEARVIFDV